MTLKMMPLLEAMMVTMAHDKTTMATMMMMNTDGNKNDESKTNLIIDYMQKKTMHSIRKHCKPELRITIPSHGYHLSTSLHLP